LLLASCSVETTGGRSPEEAVAWAGFADISGLQITASEDAGRLDAAVEFSLRGSSADLDAALDAASFSEAFEPGVGVFVQKADSVDLTGLVRVRSAEDSWPSPDGDTIHRDIIRGNGDGTEVMHVMAFTT